MRIYIAGPMREKPNFNYQAFFAAQEKLESQGHEVFNPAQKDIERYGPGIAESTDGNEETARVKFGFNLREALANDLWYICREAEAIALLPGWENSRGSRAEYATAKALDLKVMLLD